MTVIRDGAPQALLWANTLRDSLKLGFADATLLQELDDILKWYTVSIAEDGPRDEFARSLIKEYGLTAYKIRFENFLDRLIVVAAPEDFGPFEPSLDRSKAKWRYRKLISVFHPDKGANEIAWLNYRAEKVNKYYADFKRNDIQQTTINSRMSLNTSVKRRRKIRSKPSGARNVDIRAMRTRSTKRDWRDKFGDPKVLERRIITSFVIMLVLFSLLVVSSLFLAP